MSPEPLWRRVVAQARTFFAPTTVRITRGRNPSGVYVDADTVLKNATVWACIRYLTHALGQVPWQVYRAKPEGGRELMSSHPANYLLKTRPNPAMGSFTFRQVMLGTALRRGNAYAEIELDARGAAYALWPLAVDRVRPALNSEGGLDYDVWNEGQGWVTVPGQNMFHVRGFGDGPIGYDVIAYAAQSIGWAQATEIFGSSYLGEGMNPSVAVTVQKTLTPGAKEELRAELKRLYSGPKGERTFIGDLGMSLEKLGGDLEKAQFIETRQHQVEEICRWFGVPPHKVMHLLRATFSNIEHQSIEVVTDSITPWAKIFEEEADYKLFGANRQGLYTKMNLRALMRGDNASRAAFYKEMWSLGVFTINQILELEDMDPIGATGDTRFVQNVFTTLERAIAGPPAVQPPPASPAPDDDNAEASDETVPPPPGNARDRRLPN